MLLLFTFTACRHPKPSTPSPLPVSPSVKYSKSYDPEITEIMRLAGGGHWEEAQAKATALRDMAPKNAVVERVYSWVVQTGQQRREQELEERNITPVSSEIEWIPLNTIEVTEEQSEEVFKLIERVEADDDVQHVFHNMA